MAIQEKKHFVMLPGLYTRLKAILTKTPNRVFVKEPSYYKSKRNDLISDLKYFEKDSTGKYILSDNEKMLARFLYEATGPNGTISSITTLLKYLKSKLKDPLAGYIKNMADLLNSEYVSDIPLPYKGMYESAPKAHRLLVDQISMYYNR